MKRVATQPELADIKPWPEEALRDAYRRMENYWDAIEDAAIRAQGQPRMDD